MATPLTCTVRLFDSSQSLSSESSDPSSELSSSASLSHVRNFVAILRNACTQQDVT